MEQRVKEIRNYLHKNPEPSGCEEKTAEYLAEALKKAGYEVTENIGGYGVVGLLKGAAEGPVVGVRGDMDALRHEADGKEILVHSCGHDANCAMVLTMAEEMAKKGIKRGALKIIFQPAEETLSGAKAMVKAGAADDLDYLFGVHLRPVQEAKKGQAVAALRHGASTMIKASIHGHVAHGARPHMGINAIDAAVLVTNAINTIKEDPAKAWSIKTTQFNSNGVIVNSIPDRVDMSLDTRAQSNAIMDSLIKKVKDIVENVPKAIGGKGIIEYLGPVPAAEYDGEVTELFSSAIKNVLGEEGLIPAIITPGGDDFHFYKKELPSIKTGFFGLGADLAPGLHDPAMTFDENVLKDGVKILEYAVNALLN